jgi:hypothetical protein
LGPLRTDGYDLISFGELILDGGLEVGKGGAVGCDVPLYPLETVYVVGIARVVEGVVPIEELVRPPGVSTREDLIEPPADEALVLVGREERLLSRALSTYTLLGDAAKGVEDRMHSLFREVRRFGTLASAARDSSARGGRAVRQVC